MRKSVISVAILTIAVMGLFLSLRAPVTSQQRVYDLVQTPAPPEIPKEERERLAQQYRDEFTRTLNTTKQIDGPSTAGSLIYVKGDRALQLPQDVYIEALVISVACIDGQPCPEMPAYVLSFLESDDRLAFSINSGKIIEDPTIPVEKRQHIAERFKWLTEELAR